MKNFAELDAKVCACTEALTAKLDGVGGKRAFASGVKYIAEPGGSIRDDLVIEECDRKNMVMAFTGMRLFHH